MLAVNQSVVSSTSTSWNGSWTNGIPDPYSDVILNAAYNTASNGSFSCYNLTINAQFTIAENTMVKVLGTSVIQSGSVKFTIANKGQFILLNPGVDVATVKLTANFTTETKLQRLDYWFLTTPISGIPIINISPASLAARYYDYGSDNDGSTGFWPLDALVNLNTVAVKGLLIRTPNNFSTVPTDWNVSVNNLTAGSINKGIIEHHPIFYYNCKLNVNGYYVVGNPYLGNLDLRKFLLGNQEKIAAITWIWYKTNNGDRESYITINSVESRSITFSTTIRPFQGFLVQFKNVTDPDNKIVFTPDMQIVQKNFDHDYFNLAFKQSSVNIDVGACTYNSNSFQESFINSSSDSSLFAFYNNSKKMVLYKGATPFDGQIIDMYYKTVADENFIISLGGYGGSYNQYDIYLLDTVKDLAIDLKLGAYTFLGIASEESQTRFKIKITARH